MRILDVGSSWNCEPDSTILIDLKFDPDFKKQNKSKRELYEVDFEKREPLPIKTNSIDKAYCYGLLEHLSMEANAYLLKEIYRVLKYKANLYLFVPNTFYILQRLAYMFGVMPSDFVLCHKQHFSHRAFESMLYGAGFKMPHRENFIFYLPFGFLQKNLRVQARKTE